MYLSKIIQVERDVIGTKIREESEDVWKMMRLYKGQ